MRTLLTAPLTILLTAPTITQLACGPLAPPVEDTTTASTTTASTTTETPATTETTTTAAPTSSTPTTTTSDPNSTSDADFLITPDGPIEQIQCSIYAQDCPRGQKCAAYAEGGGNSWNALKCVDITGDDAPGEPCSASGGGVSGMDSCALGAMCWEVDQTNQGTCIAQCTGSDDAPICPAMSLCYISGEGSLQICIPTCDPLLQDCDGDKLCIPNNDTFTCDLDASGEQGQLNDPCEFFNSCDKGLVCLNTAAASAACNQNSQGCCQPFCQFPGAPCPNPDQQCLQWYDPRLPIPEGSENLGVCAIPA